MYRVIKVLNNNGVLALDMEKKQEVILLGNGVGFGKKMGQRFGGSPDARRYELVKKETSALQAVNGIDPVYIEVTARIIEAAEGLLGPIRHDILIAMADHIALAVSRAKEGCELPNPFSQDIRALFSQEYEAALKGRDLIRQELGVEISEDEVSYITLHIHGGLSDENVSQSLELARLVQDGIRQVEEGMRMTLPAASLGYNRLMSHLRYMIARTRKKEQTNLNMGDYARENFPRAYEVAAQVCEDIGRKLKCPVAQEEIGFLAIHIQRAAGQG